MAGRKPMSDYDKLLSKVSKQYLTWQHTLTNEFIEDQENGRLQFVESEKRMGRPPIPFAIQQVREKVKYEKRLAEFRTYEEENSLEVLSKEDIKNSSKKEKRGRPASDQVVTLKKYLRRTEILRQQTKESEDNLTEQEGRGRKAMTKAEKAHYYKLKLIDIQSEIDNLIAEKPLVQQLKYKLDDLRLDQRNWKKEVKAGNSDAENELKDTQSKITLLEKEIKQAEDQDWIEMNKQFIAKKNKS